MAISSERCCYASRANQAARPQRRTRTRPASETKNNNNNNSNSFKVASSSRIDKLRRRQSSVHSWLLRLALLATLLGATKILASHRQVSDTDTAPAERARRQHQHEHQLERPLERQHQADGQSGGARGRRAPAAAALAELRASGSKSEPPSRPSVERSKQRPQFGADLAREVAVELGKTAYLACKVFELGDKTVSWLKPSQNEILTVGRYTYVGDTRFSSLNEPASPDWILEIKDVALSDSTNYECQVSTDPKMSAIIKLHVKALRAKIRQGDQYHAPTGSRVEFSCEIGPGNKALPAGGGDLLQQQQQTYWYFNGNLLNYAQTQPSAIDKNFTIELDPKSNTSRFRLLSVAPSDAGNYTCKPSSAEPASIRLTVSVKKPGKNGHKDRFANRTPTGLYKESQTGRYNQLPSRESEPNCAQASLSTQAELFAKLCALLATSLLILVRLN